MALHGKSAAARPAVGSQAAGAPWHRLSAGRIWVDYGPTQMLVQAESNGQPHDAAAAAGAGAALAALAAVSAHLAVLRRPWPDWGDRLPTLVTALPLPVAAMLRATYATGDATLTPMAAVAGSISDAAAVAMCQAGASRAVANNGGDIAVHLAPDQALTVGLLPDAAGRATLCLQVPGDARVGGICTSGLGGRSFTRGIATSVTILAANAAMADAAATLVANATHVPHPAVEQVLARDLDPLTDIPDLTVTVQVGLLPVSVVEQALNQARQAVTNLAGGGLIAGAVVAVAGHRLLMLPRSITYTEPAGAGSCFIHG